VSRLLDIAPGGATYAAAGVDIDAGDEAVDKMKEVVRSTHRPGVMGSIGDFGGLFHLASLGLSQPVLVSSADGVGTKLHIAQVTKRFDGVGDDLVAMLVDDLVCVGAEPLFLLDIITVGKVVPERIAAIVSSIATACRRANTALLGGETAEHGGIMGDDDIDVAGFAVGVLEDGTQLGAHRVRPGDALLGFHSPGIRSNGYSLARSVLLPGRSLDEPAWTGASASLADELLRPSVVYAPAVVALKAALGESLHGVAHITGGGIVGNVPRMLPANCDAVIDMTAFETPEIFFEIQRRGSVATDEMLRVFNCGLGMTLAVEPTTVEDAITIAREHGVTAHLVGYVRDGQGTVEIQ
jgi:phosphoribosylformylglycinamidine cyclo-ligase